MRIIKNRLLVALHPEKVVQIYEQDIKPFTKGGQSKFGKEFEPTKSIRRICAHIRSTDFNCVLDALRDEDLCDDLFLSTKSPIDVRFDAVDDNTQTISYFRRGASPDNPKTLKFGRLRNILTKIRKTP
jgi:hypothetical protein